jgi:hypothetical protein
MNEFTLRTQLEASMNELAAIRLMSEAEACRMYSVDFKREIEAILMEEIASLEREISYNPDMDYEEVYDDSFNY